MCAARLMQTTIMQRLQRIPVKFYLWPGIGLPLPVHVIASFQSGLGDLECDLCFSPEMALHLYMCHVYAAVLVGEPSPIS